MDALMNNTPGGGGKPETMTSLEIAEVVTSAHADVRRSIERLAERGVITLPPTAEVPNPRSGPKTINVYQVSERESYIVVAQLSPEFTASLVDFWQKNRHATAPAIPMTPAELVLQNAQALVAYERRQAEQQAEIDAVRSDLAEIKQAHHIVDKMPTECEGIERIRKRINKKYSLSVPVVDTIMRNSPYAPTIRVLVRNPHAEGVTNSGYSIKEVSAIFRRFVSECTHSAGHLHTHPYIEGRFKLVKGDAT